MTDPVFDIDWSTENPLIEANDALLATVMQQVVREQWLREVAAKAGLLLAAGLGPLSPHNGRYVVNDFWSCSESPLRMCLYDHHHDPGCDQCLFCGDPMERK